MGSGLMTAVKAILSIAIGAGLAYFWDHLNPTESFEILVGVGAVGTLAAFVSFYFMGKGSG